MAVEAVEAIDEDAGLELDELDALLKVLTKNNVHSFQGGGLTVVFNETELKESVVPTQASTIGDDGHSTSSKRVSGFRDGALWQWQNGKVLNFKGELE